MVPRAESYRTRFLTVLILKGDMITDRLDFKLRYMGNDILRQKTEEVTYHSGIKDICNKMIDIMYHMRAWGLAANQVGIPYRIFVMDTEYSLDKKRRPIDKRPFTFINPVITSTSDTTKVAPEGCLSIPGQEIKKERHVSVNVEYIGIDGHTYHDTFHDLAARCIQHEVDHLDGKLMIDDLPNQQRLLIQSKHMKNMRRRR